MDGGQRVELTLAQIADAVGGEVAGDPDFRVSGAAPFEHAAETEITFAAQERFLKRLHETRAGAVIVPRGFAGARANLVRASHPQVAFARVLQMFHPQARPVPGISPQACIGQGFRCGEEVHIAAFVAIGDDVTLGNRVTVHPHVAIGSGASLGDDVEIFPNVTILDRCRIGNRVVVHAGTVIGSDGFGFAHDGRRYHKIPHTGIVQIDDDVEIGACNTIDRATFGVTRICRGVKTDNMVHVAHNVTVGEDTVIVAQVAIAGSTTIGNHVIIAGQAAVSGHLTVGDNAVIGPRAGVARSIDQGEVVSGAPEMPHRTWLKVQSVIPRLPELKKRIETLESRLKQAKQSSTRGTPGEENGSAF